MFNITQFVCAIILAAGIPSSLFALALRRLEKKLDERDRQIQQKEEARHRNETLMITMIFASLSLGEATAEAVQRIPDAHCNGDMYKALENAKQAKEEYRRFERDQVIKSLH